MHAGACAYLFFRPQFLEFIKGKRSNTLILTRWQNSFTESCILSSSFSPRSIFNLTANCKSTRISKHAKTATVKITANSFPLMFSYLYGFVDMFVPDCPSDNYQLPVHRGTSVLL